MLSKIEIIFNAEVDLEEYVCIGIQSISNPSLNTEWHIRYKVLRTAAFTASTLTPTAIPGEASAIAWVQAVNLDYNPASPSGSRYWDISRVNNVVTITAPNDLIKFVNTSLLHPQSDAISTSVDNVDPSETINIDSVTFSGATTNPVCSHYKVTVTTSNLASHIFSPSEAIETGNTDNPIVFEMPRGVPFTIQVGDSDGIKSTKNFGINQVPYVFTSANIEVTISQSPNGATVSGIVNSTSTASQTYTYSLNGTDYQASNVFPGLPDGDYTIYVKDNFGCIKTLDFTVTTDNVVVPYSYISKSLSIRYALRQTLQACGPYRTEENSLSCESFAADPELAYREDQQFNSCDIITTQIKSNYSVISAKVIKEDGTEVIQTVNKLSNNIGLKDARDCTVYNIGNNQSGVYFTTGNIYDFDTELDTDEDYALNGGLPEWGVIGNYVKLGASWFQILNVIFDESIGAEVLVINLAYSGSPYSEIAKCQFNRQIYEVYEFETVMSSYLDSKIQIQIDETDPVFDDITRISEYLDIKESHPGTVKIEYYNEANSDIFYRTGIKNIIRIPIDLIAGSHDDETSEILKADTRSDLISSEVYEIDEFTFHPVTKGIYRKIVLALSHEYVSIDGTFYVKNGSIEKEGPLEDSNLYVIKAKMLKTATPFVTNVYGSESEIIANEEILEVPNLIITGNDEFISQ